jgi:hypothetical protein
VITPVFALIVATEGVAEDHVPPAIDELRLPLPPIQIAVLPDITPALGSVIIVLVTPSKSIIQLLASLICTL